MNKLNTLSLNLQQTLVFDENSENWCSVLGVHNKHKNLLLVRPTIETITNKELEESLVSQIKDTLESEGLVCDKVIFGDGLMVDTWDKSIGSFKE